MFTGWSDYIYQFLCTMHHLCSEQQTTAPDLWSLEYMSCFNNSSMER